jgi:hypothetical protein
MTFINPLLYALGVLALSYLTPLDSAELLDNHDLFINPHRNVKESNDSQASHVLYNGVKAFFQENPYSNQFASVRVALRTACDRQCLFTLETTSNNSAAIEDFFSDCTSKITHFIDGKAYDLLGSFSELQELVIFAVGDFSAVDMPGIIEKHFKKFSLSSPEPLTQSKVLDTHPARSKISVNITYPITQTDVLTACSHLDYANGSHWAFDTATEEPYIFFADNIFPKENLTCLIDTINQSSVDLFYQLPLTEREQRQIAELMKTIGEKNIWGLLFRKREVEKMGKKVNHVHPMRFISHILGDPKLRKHLKEVKNSSFKWDHFIDGFAKRMKEETHKQNVTPYIPGMAHYLQVDPEEIAAFIQKKDYEGLVKALL